MDRHRKSDRRARGMSWTVALHGGAGVLSRSRKKEKKDALLRALDAAAAILDAKGGAVDAVAAAVVVLEDSGLFNAGRGAVCNAAGAHELDASIMDGATLQAGGVAGVRRVRNPVLAALRVMRETPHVLLIGAGAERFARQRVAEAYFVRSKKRAARHGTVGAVALDANGNLAAATSTGGTSAKLPGRVGDSPLVGAGTYADNATCAVSGTGLGEAFMRTALAYDVAARMRYLGESLPRAARAALRGVAAIGGDGGLVAVDRRGRIAMPFNSPGMARASLSARGRRQVEP
jgi:isoaspartyl peptidase/L-asparaginase-like protein (Ntn-hydrolase superfamily)